MRITQIVKQELGKRGRKHNGTQAIVNNMVHVTINDKSLTKTQIETRTYIEEFIRCYSKQVQGIKTCDTTM